MVPVLLSACGMPFGIGSPTTRALESGAAESLDASRSLRITGSYSESGTVWKIDLELVKPSTAHLILKGGPADLEAILTSENAYFRGRDFLSAQMGTDAVSRALVQATGNAWWKGPTSYMPQLPDFTQGSLLTSTFLGAAVTARTDHVSVGDTPAVELSGPRADVFIAEAPPYPLLRLHTRTGVVIDGITDADLSFSDFDRDFGIAAPLGAVNFADASTLPPIYTVISVDTSGCLSTCTVSALLKNLGGRRGLRGATKVTFTMTETNPINQSSYALGACVTEIQQDVDHNATTTASCVINGLSGIDHNAAVVTAKADSQGLA
ncbi:MAG: hypothetical protein PVS3B2_11150 [Candidatus Dormibacteraceae bacterium]